MGGRILKYIIDIPTEMAEATARYWNETTDMTLIPYIESDQKAIEDEVWEFVKKIECLTIGETEDCFDVEYEGIPFVANMFSYQEAKAKYEAWLKKKDEIHVGDELKDDGNIKAVVLDILDADYESYEVFTENGIVDEWQKGIVVKTGRHFDEVEELMKKMRWNE